MTENEERDAVNPTEIESDQKRKISDTVRNSGSNKDEIDLIELFLTFWSERLILFITVFAFFVIGLITALTGREEYTAEVKLLPESRQHRATSGLMRQFGIDISRTQEDEGISTRFYPHIARSYPFLKEFFDYEIFVSNAGRDMTLMEFFNDYHTETTFFSRFTSRVKKYTIHLPFTVASWFERDEVAEQALSEREPDSEKEESVPAENEVSDGSGNIVRISGREGRVISRLRSRVSVRRDDDGFIVVSVRMPEPEAAADLTEHVTNSLIDYIKTDRTEKARNDLEFIEERYEEARRRFVYSQEGLARFRDETRGQLTQLARTQEQRLQSEYDIAFNVYNTLANRLEEARLKIQEETPVVRVVEPVVVPRGPSEPNRERILVIYTILGIFTGGVLIFVRLVWKKIREAINQKT